ncbi:cobalt ECF transporter T component CbiQ [Paramagnetospirillum kuznetsovii]|uniref:Cobalt ECF transporter T component CbiQ n=1 Tax=Paramagnetospirillum kuznetsovii TaxID=2053833 RepID=A0A364P0H5_9PROT|nr:cobalt ECF transporter T component CbiQ [Paramagnetospirillum kuznetsovii]RAU22842.1 cobalt ECF transporter T component CbiQ [Paramagnetospirillum kuznetsovii]
MSLLGPCRCDAILDGAEPQDGPSLMERLDPRTRVILAVLFALVVVTVDALAALALALGVAVLAAALARLPLGLTLRRLLALEGFMVAVLLLLPFTVEGRVVAEPLGFAASAEGLRQACVIALRANAVAVALLALLGSMDVVRLGRALSRLGAPRRLVHLFLFTIRYIDVLDREYRRLRLAMRARAFRPAAGLHCWRSVGYLFGMLMVRSLERAERIDAAMRCRGFTGQFPSLEDDDIRPPGALDWGLGAVSAVMLALVVGLGV